MNYTYMHIEVCYDPSGGLVPTGMKVSVSEINLKDFPKEGPDIVATWHILPPAALKSNLRKQAHRPGLDQHRCIQGARGRQASLGTVHGRQTSLQNYR